MIITDLANHVCGDIIRDVAARNARKFMVTNFRYPDGDLITLYLDDSARSPRLTDHGATLKKFDMAGHANRSARLQSIISAICADFGLTIVDDAITRSVGEDEAGYDVLSLCQALVRISSLDYVSQSRSTSTLPEQVEAFLLSQIRPVRHVCADWTDERFDPHDVYPVDFRINGGDKKPANIFCVPSTSKSTLVSAVSNLLRVHGDTARTLAIIDPAIQLGVKNTERLQLASDIIEYGLSGNEPAIKEFALAS